MTQKDTKQRILDAAEKLFAQDGYHNTSLRAITQEAQANIAAVNYHFGSKEDLIAAVLERRLLPLNNVRRKRLDDVREKARQEGRPPRVEETVLAVIEPTLLFRESSPRAKFCTILIGRALAEADDTVRRIFINLVMPVFDLWHELLAEALPEVPRDILYFRLHFSIGALAHTMHHDDKWPIEANTDDPVRRVAAKDLVDMLVRFITAGMGAPR